MGAISVRLRSFPEVVIPGPAKLISFFNRRSELSGGVELLSTAQASHHDLAASDVSGGPFPAPLSRLDLRGMAEWTLYGRALGSRAIHRLRIRGLRILGWCCGRWRGWILQRLPTSAAKAGREVYRCSTVRAVDSRSLIHVALLSALSLIWSKMLPKILSKKPEDHRCRDYNRRSLAPLLPVFL